jgi:chemotaxis protein CheD
MSPPPRKVRMIKKIPQSPPQESWRGEIVRQSEQQGRSAFDGMSSGPSRYFSQKFQKQAVRLGPCHMYITSQLDEMLETVLGSCVTACIRDSQAGVAGINHFMLPATDQPRSNDLMTTLRYGNHSMDLLIEGLMRRGAKSHRLEIKVFGGANVMPGPVVGEANAEWVLRYLQDRKLPVAAQHLGGSLARSVHYFPATGLVLLQQLEPNKTE